MFDNQKKYRATTLETQKDIECQTNELQQLQKSAGTNILKLLGHYRQQITRPVRVNGETRLETKMYDVYVTEQMEFDLKKFMQEGPAGMNRVTTFSLITQLLNGVKHMKTCNISHNDLKPSNVLLKIIPGDWDVDVELSIGDLGMAEISGGTPGWPAPEFLKGTIPGVSDVYTAGLVILYLLTVKRPDTTSVNCSENEPPADLFYMLRDNVCEINDSDRQNIFEKFPELELIGRMLEVDPTKRISIEDAINEWKKLGN